MTHQVCEKFPGLPKDRGSPVRPLADRGVLLKARPAWNRNGDPQVAVPNGVCGRYFSRVTCPMNSFRTSVPLIS
jgi:hypothetical protein